MSIPKEIAEIKLVPGVIACRHVGSRVTCNPPPTDTDDDWLVFANKDAFTNLVEQAGVAGFEVGGSKIEHENGSGFLSFKRGDVNIILTDDLEFFDRFLAASTVCQRLNLLDKSDRIAVFRAVLYAEGCAPPEMGRPT